MGVLEEISQSLPYYQDYAVEIYRDSAPVQQVGVPLIRRVQTDTTRFVGLGGRVSRYCSGLLRGARRILEERGLCTS